MDTPAPVLRPLADSDSERDPGLPARLGDAVPGLDEQRHRADLAAGRCRPEWNWVAEVHGRVVARALWWGLPESRLPLALECLQVDPSVPDRAGLAAALLRAGLADLAARGLDAPPPYTLVLDAGWRSDPATAAAVDWRREAARAVGLTEELERLRYVWTPQDGLPAPAERLVLTPEPDDAVVLEVLQRVAQGSLDVDTRRDLEASGPEEQARGDLEFYRSMPGERSWWRLAHTRDGRLAGLAIPSRTAYGPNVGYLGVVPELRGAGLVHELLAEITRFHAARGAERVTGTTDATNTPTAAAFARAGYRGAELRLQLSCPRS